MWLVTYQFPWLHLTLVTNLQSSFLSVLKVRVIEVKSNKLNYKYKFRVEKVLKGDRSFTGKKVSYTQHFTMVTKYIYTSVFVSEFFGISGQLGYGKTTELKHYPLPGNVWDKESRRVRLQEEEVSQEETTVRVRTNHNVQEKEGENSAEDIWGEWWQFCSSNKPGERQRLQT